MSWLSWITGGSKAADKVIDGIVNTGDALFFTSEEKSEFDMKRQELWLELQKTLGSESSPRSVNRRVVAWTVMLMTASLTLLCILFNAIGKPELADYVQEVTVQFKWPWAFCGVIVFYFGTHLVGAINK